MDDFELLKDAIQIYLRFHGEFPSDASNGIAKKIIASHNMPHLTESQQYVFKNFIMKELENDCRRCATQVPFEELDEFFDSGLCSYCSHMEQKNMDD